MKISVRGYRRIARADLDLSPIALVAGQNGAGKTSLFQAVAAALTKNTTPMGIAKKDAGFLVHRGVGAGSVKVTTEGGHVQIDWPECKGTYEGQDPPRASTFAAGTECILDLKSDARAKALAGYVNSAPVITDLYDAMNDAGFTDDAVRKTWEAIEADGWDAVHRKSSEFGANLKGQWEAVTGERYGSAKAADWRPDGWTDELAAADLSSLEREIAEAKATLEKTIATSAVSADEIKRLRADVAAFEPTALEKMRDAISGAREAVEEAEKERAALPAADADEGIPCPSCGTHLMVDRAYKGPTTLKLAEKVTEADLKKRRTARAEADGKCERLRGDLATLQTSLAGLENKQRAAELAQKRLAEVGGADAPAGGATAAEVDAAREAVAKAEKAHAAANAKLRADRIHGQIARNAKLIEILAPDGLRRRKLAAGLESFNADLAELCASAGWPAVRLDEELSAHYGAEPYWNCSESQQMRVRITLQVAIAQADQSSAVLIDRADMLDQKGRNGLFGMLKAAGLPALVLMTANVPDKVPDLRRAGLGASYWLDGGALSPIGQAETRAAA